MAQSNVVSHTDSLFYSSVHKDNHYTFVTICCTKRHTVVQTRTIGVILLSLEKTEGIMSAMVLMTEDREAVKVALRGASLILWQVRWPQPRLWRWWQRCKDWNIHLYMQNAHPILYFTPPRVCVWFYSHARVYICVWCFVRVCMKFCVCLCVCIWCSMCVCMMFGACVSVFNVSVSEVGVFTIAMRLHVYTPRVSFM